VSEPAFDFAAVGGRLCGAVRFGQRGRLSAVEMGHCPKRRKVSGGGSKTGWVLIGGDTSQFDEAP
jgi:hypothetical protein